MSQPVVVLVGIIIGLFTLVVGWLFLMIQKEKTLAVYRAKDMHDKLREQKLEVDERILEVLELMRKMMPQSEVKDFVDREFKPVHKTLGQLIEGQNKNNELTSELKTNIQVLIDRDNNK